MKKTNFLKLVIGASLICIVGLCCRTCFTGEDGRTSSELQPAGEEQQPVQPDGKPGQAVGTGDEDSPPGPIEIIPRVHPVSEVLKNLRKNPDSTGWRKALEQAEPTGKDMNLLIRELRDVRLTLAILRLLEKNADKMTQAQVENMWEVAKALVEEFGEPQGFDKELAELICRDLLDTTIQIIFAGEADARLKEQVLKDLVKFGEKRREYVFALTQLHRFGSLGLKAALSLLEKIPPEERRSPGPDRIAELHRQIAQIRDPEAVSILMKMLEKKEDLDLVDSAATALSAMGKREAIPILKEMVGKKESPDIVRIASEALLALGEELDAKLYIQMLKSREDEVRGVGLSILGELRKSDAVRPIFDNFKRALAEHNRMAEGFGKSGAEFSNMDFESEARKCFSALGRIGTIEAIEYLMSVFRNPDVHVCVRSNALSAVKNSPNDLKKEVLPELKNMVDDRSLPKGIRVGAADFVHEITGDDSYLSKRVRILEGKE